MDVAIRQGLASDAPHLAEICLLADPGTFEFLLGGIRSGTSATDILTALCGVEGTPYSFRHFTLAQRDGDVLGGYNAIPSGELRALDDNLAMALKDQAGLGTVAVLRWFMRRMRLARRSKAMPIPDGALVIGNLAVFPPFRGAGVGRRLIEHAVTTAQAGGMDSVCLFVWAERPEALGLYRKMGFEIACTAPFRPHRLLPYRARHLMRLQCHKPATFE
jgi:ribosomal protein S18 acetylase RimI-like enzyme